jgi:hypothetical protein
LFIQNVDVPFKYKFKMYMNAPDDGENYISSFDIFCFLDKLRTVTLVKNKRVCKCNSCSDF